MTTECIQDSLDFGTVEGRRVVGAFDGGAMTSDGGALLLGATDRAIRLIERFAACFSDARAPDLIEHSLDTLVGQRVFGLALGYEDLVDHDLLRHDPVMATLIGKLQAGREDCAPLAGKSTLNRSSNPCAAAWAATTRSARHRGDRGAVRDAVPGGASAPAEADRARPGCHRRSPARPPGGRFFHGYYDTYCYLPLYIFCGRHLLAAKLRRANIDAAHGAREEVERIVKQIRAAGPTSALCSEPTRASAATI
jgi:hypothetical protein